MKPTATGGSRVAAFRLRQQSSENQIDEDGDLPELVEARWYHHGPAVAGTSFWSVARRLPTMIHEALTLAWRASPRDTVTTIALNLAAGVMTTLGLLAASSVLTELFAGGPTPDPGPGRTARAERMFRGGQDLSGGQ
jgi:ATP-binding cassette subfamily B protein/ATP-binding cassette subfamily C protein